MTFNFSNSYDRQFAICIPIVHIFSKKWLVNHLWHNYIPDNELLIQKLNTLCAELLFFEFCIYLCELPVSLGTCTRYIHLPHLLEFLEPCCMTGSFMRGKDLDDDDNDDDDDDE